MLIQLVVPIIFVLFVASLINLDRFLMEETVPYLLGKLSLFLFVIAISIMLTSITLYNINPEICCVKEAKVCLVENIAVIISDNEAININKEMRSNFNDGDIVYDVRYSKGPYFGIYFDEAKRFLKYNPMEDKE